MRTDFTAFFQYTDRNFAVCLRCQLFDTDRSRQTGWSATDHDHVIFHSFAWAKLRQQVLSLSHGVSRSIFLK